MLKVVPWLPSRLFAQLGSLAPQLVGSTLGSIVANPDNMDPKHIRMLLRNAIEDLPASLLEQFAEWDGGPPGFKRHDGLLEYYAQISSIQVPMLVIAGTGDLLSPVEVQAGQPCVQRTGLTKGWVGHRVVVVPPTRPCCDTLGG